MKPSGLSWMGKAVQIILTIFWTPCQSIGEPGLLFRRATFALFENAENYESKMIIPFARI